MKRLFEVLKMTEKCENPRCNQYFWCGEDFCPNRPELENEAEQRRIKEEYLSGEE